MSPSSPRLARSEDRWIGGVCGGLAEFLGWTPTGVRALYVFVSVVSAGFPGIVAYLVLWWVMPPPPTGRFDLEAFRRQ
jgi:phage shock protein C